MAVRRIPGVRQLSLKETRELLKLPYIRDEELSDRNFEVRVLAEDLARASRVGVATIRRAELAERETSMTAPNDMAIRQALEEVGVEFIDENGGGPGVRLRKRQTKKG